MNKHILVGIRVSGAVHKVILDGVDYCEIKKRYNEIQDNEEFSKVEIWSRANGLEKSKRLKPKQPDAENVPEDVSPSELTDTEKGKGEDGNGAVSEEDGLTVTDESEYNEDEEEDADESDSDDFENGIEKKKT